MVQGALALVDPKTLCEYPVEDTMALARDDSESWNLTSTSRT